MTKREELIAWLQDHDRLPSGTTITCDTCADADNCKFAFDPYNINGDCLGDK